ncbi:helix-turn-helix domain-containing protein [Chryseobacterium sp. 3008163]|uniref:helix-turn-helix domain-containing protein n=1 Tax=Chryseobacterium sp. 3008163 TaxID=2478663 RepID=UPI000F0C3F6A|nr:helix-turn-helix domain-containing protein [Chryseobacterium sp. 3008163]AYM99082.1 helix-turn-helix domain-containing protein [Chryseobacterium sp. 3008163]
MDFEGVNYKVLYTDLINKKFPEKMRICQNILKKKVSVLDAIKMNDLLFPQKLLEDEQFNQKHKSYMEDDIMKILEYQRINNLTNTQVALKYKLSRNTVAKWKRLFL